MYGYHGEAERLAAAGIARGHVAAQFAVARDRAQGRLGRAAIRQPGAWRLKGVVGGMPVFNPDTPLGLNDEQEAILRGQLDERIDKVLGIIAILLNDAGSDIAQMQDMLDVIRAMDDLFFDCDEDMDEDKARRMRRLKSYYYGKFFTAASFLYRASAEE